MRLRAKKECFVNGARRRKGDVFDVDVAEDVPVPDYLEEVGDGAPAARAEPEVPEKEEPVALSELAGKAPADAPESLGQAAEGDPDVDPSFLD